MAYACYKVFEEKEFDGGVTSAFDSLFAIENGRHAWLILPIILLPFNLGTETLKWQLLLKKVEIHISFFAAYKAVLAGLATGIFTPNRFGEYAGRALFVEAAHRPQAIAFTFVDRICQMVITLGFGGLSLLLFWLNEGSPIRQALNTGEFPIGWKTGIVAILILLILLVLVPKHRLKGIFSGKGIRSWIQEGIDAITAVKFPDLLKVLALASFRYLVFSFQYFFFLLVFGCTQDMILVLGLISLVFLFKSLVPFIGFSELGIRESIAVFLMGLFGIASSTAFNATLSLYLVNMIIPTLIGAILLLSSGIRK